MDHKFSARVALTILFFQSINVSAVLDQDRDGDSNRTIQPLPEKKEELLKAVVTGWRQNRSQLQKLAFDVERTVQVIPVIFPGVNTAGKKAEFFTPEKTTRGTCIYRYDADVMKEEYVTPTDISFGTVTVARNGRYCKYVPSIKQAWITTGIPDVDVKTPIDLRCAGLRPPISDLGGWLEGWDVEAIRSVADATGRAVVRLSGKWLGPHGKNVLLTVDFDPAMSFVPVAVTERYAGNDTVMSIATLEYQPIKNGKVWFLKRERVRCYPNGTTLGPERGRPNLILENVVLGAPKTEIESGPDEFDPILRPKTLLLGDLRAQPVSPSVPVRASKMTRDLPEVPVPRPGLGYPK
jgi:hypothetical protein